MRAYQPIVQEQLASLYRPIYKNVMKKLNIQEVKTHLSRYLPLLEKGESILLCKRNVPIAEIRPLSAVHKTKRPIGLAKGEFSVPPEFFEPLPDDLLMAFAGEGK